MPPPPAPRLAPSPASSPPPTRPPPSLRGAAVPDASAPGSAAAPLRTFAARRMEHTAFGDLSLRLGKSYCYCHQGSCEHLVRVLGMRRLAEGDSRLLSDYPACTFWVRLGPCLHTLIP